MGQVNHMRNPTPHPRQTLTRTTLLAVSIVPALIPLGGCGGSTYNGSDSFYDQHPQYRDEPAYMHASDADDQNAGKPF